MTAQQSTPFHLGDILSITTGMLVSPRHMDGIYEILNYMTGDNLFTHQLPRASEQCAPMLLEQHPHLRAVEAPPRVDRDEEGAWVSPWLRRQVALYGEYLPVDPISAAQRVMRDPIRELEEMVGRDRVVTVMLPTEP